MTPETHLPLIIAMVTLNHIADHAAARASVMELIDGVDGDECREVLLTAVELIHQMSHSFAAILDISFEKYIQTVALVVAGEEAP